MIDKSFFLDLAVYCLVSLNVCISLRVINFSDMTCDGAFSVGACGFVMSSSMGFGFYTALLMGTVFGGIAGLLTAFLATKFRINTLLAGIITVTSMQSINIKLLGGQNSINLSSLQIPQISIFTVLLFVFLVFALTFLFLSSKFGLAVRGVGGNANFADKLGISYASIIKMVLTMGNAVVGFAGAIFVTSQKQVTTGIGSGSLVVGMIAMVVGEKFIKAKGVFALLCIVLVGTIFYKTLLLLATHERCFGIDSSYANLLTGVMIVIVYLLRDLKDRNDRN